MIVVEGSFVFHLKATHGTPWDMVCENLIVDRGLRIDWVGFIEAARQNGWWDFQTIPAVENDLRDAGVPTEMVEAIIVRMKHYVLTHKHPASNNDS